jgi:uncharacterized membrane protein YphA (DoxX/SURF4 family)
MTGAGMNKTIAIYGAQAAMGLLTVAAGYAKLSGADVMVQQFALLGLGKSFLFVAGCVEILAGLCLLMPRGGIVGAVLLVCVTVGAMGMTIGHVASAASHSAPAQQLTISHIQTMERDTRTASRTFTVVQHRAQWDI